VNGRRRAQTPTSGSRPCENYNSTDAQRISIATMAERMPRKCFAWIWDDTEVNEMPANSDHQLARSDHNGYVRMTTTRSRWLRNCSCWRWQMGVGRPLPPRSSRDKAEFITPGCTPWDSAAVSCPWRRQRQSGCSPYLHHGQQLHVKWNYFEIIMRLFQCFISHVTNDRS